MKSPKSSPTRKTSAVPFPAKGISPSRVTKAKDKEKLTEAVASPRGEKARAVLAEVANAVAAPKKYPVPSLIPQHKLHDGFLLTEEQRKLSPQKPGDKIRRTRKTATTPSIQADATPDLPYSILKFDNNKKYTIFSERVIETKDNEHIKIKYLQDNETKQWFFLKQYILTPAQQTEEFIRTSLGESYTRLDLLNQEIDILKQSMGMLETSCTREKNGNLNVYVLQKWIPCPDLAELYNAGGIKSFPEACMFLTSLIKQVGILHKNGLLHNDLKPENVLGQGKSYRTQIIDFEYSFFMASETDRRIGLSKLVGTHGYVAPEVYTKVNGLHEFSEATDWYSVGMTAFNLLSACVERDFDGDAEVRTWFKQLFYSYDILSLDPAKRQNAQTFPKILKEIHDVYAAYVQKYDAEVALQEQENAAPAEPLVDAVLNKPAEAFTPIKDAPPRSASATPTAQALAPAPKAPPTPAKSVRKQLKF